MIGRRELLAAGAAGLVLALPARADACSIVANPPERFSDRSCRRALRLWVELLNRAPSMSAEALSGEVEEISVSIDEEMIDSVASERINSTDERRYAFYRDFRMSGGKLDTRPIRIDEVNLIRQLGGRATYQFTLERFSYHPADPEGCNGLFTHDEYWGVDRVSYLATFWNNRLESVKPFPEWYLEERA